MCNQIEKRDSLVAQMVKNVPVVWETWVLIPALGRSPGGGHGNPLQYSCLKNSHGQRRLAGCSPWGCKELDTTERLRTAQQIEKYSDILQFICINYSIIYVSFCNFLFYLNYILEIFLSQLVCIFIISFSQCLSFTVNIHYDFVSGLIA